MQLRIARLCLDCEEIHDGQQCPVCASETFAYLSRWVPAPERRTHPRSTQQESPAQAPTPPANRSSKGRTALGYSVLGLGVIGVTRWLLRGRDRIESVAIRNAGDLK